MVVSGNYEAKMVYGVSHVLAIEADDSAAIVWDLELVQTAVPIVWIGVVDRRLSSVFIDNRRLENQRAIMVGMGVDFGNLLVFHLECLERLVTRAPALVQWRFKAIVED